MATEEQKKARMLQLFNDMIFGFSKGLYDLFGDSALATVDSIGQGILGEMEQELGLEIQGEDPKDMVLEIERLLVDEYGLVKSIEIEADEGKGIVDMTCEGCLLAQTTRNLQEDGVPPYSCVPMMIVSTALRKRLGLKSRLVGSEHDPETGVCGIKFQVLG